MGIFVAMIAAVAIFVLTPARAQETASVHGKVNNAAGQMLDHGDVKLSHDQSGDVKTMKFTNTFPIEKDGSYKGTGIAPGDYFAFVIQDGKPIDRLPLKAVAGQDTELNFDMTRPEYIKTLTPEEKKALEEFKTKNAATVNENKKIANLNATLLAVRTDLEKNASTHGDVSKDVDDMKSAIDAKPDESVLWFTYARALESQGDHLAEADHQAHKPISGDDVAMKDYDTAIDAFKKSVDLSAASKKPNPADQAAAWNGVGNSLSKEGKPKDAADAFESAVKLQPENAGMFYSNEAAVLFNAGQTDAADAAADKAIAADPNRPDPYFIKGQALIAKSTFDAKTQKIVPPPGCVDAYQHYLALAPDGPHAQSVREVLASLGEKVDTHYKAGRH
jgi:tetratricopeptide (TPR) repeat protein